MRAIGGRGCLQPASLPRHAARGAGQVDSTGRVTHIPGKLAFPGHDVSGHLTVGGRVGPLKRAIEPEACRLEVAGVLVAPAREFGVLRLHGQERLPVGAAAVGAQLPDHLNLAMDGREYATGPEQVVSVDQGAP